MVQQENPKEASAEYFPICKPQTNHLKCCYKKWKSERNKFKPVKNSNSQKYFDYNI